MTEKKCSTLIRGLGMGLILVAIPFGFSPGDLDVNASPTIEVNEACAQSGGTCVPEYYQICMGMPGYHHYQWD